jgi:hypothetical protein
MKCIKQNKKQKITIKRQRKKRTIRNTKKGFRNGGTIGEIKEIKKSVLPLLAKANLKTGINEWGESNSADLKIMLKKLKKHNVNDYKDDLTLFGINWGDIKTIHYEKEPINPIYMVKKNSDSHPHQYCLHDTFYFDVPILPEIGTKYTFIKLLNGPLFLYIETCNGGHRDIISNLNNCCLTTTTGMEIRHPLILFCEVAGELMFDNNHEIESWNCQSGTFKPQCGTTLNTIYEKIDGLPKEKYVDANYSSKSFNVDDPNENGLPPLKFNNLSKMKPSIFTGRTEDMTTNRTKETEAMTTNRTELTTNRTEV